MRGRFTDAGRVSLAESQLTWGSSGPRKSKRIIKFLCNNYGRYQGVIYLQDWFKNGSYNRKALKA